MSSSYGNKEQLKILLQFWQHQAWLFRAWGRVQDTDRSDQSYEGNPEALVKKIKLLDCPGLVLARGNMSDASVVLRNSIKLETIAGPMTPVVAILDRAHIMLQYGIRLFEDTGVPGKVGHSAKTPAWKTWRWWKRWTCPSWPWWDWDLVRTSWWRVSLRKFLRWRKKWLLGGCSHSGHWGGQDYWGW